MICLECGTAATENAHLIPRSRGGTATVPLCGACHGRMHGMSRAQDIGTLTREGLARARVAGVKLGRPRTLDNATVQRIQDAHGSGQSLRTIAAGLNDDQVPTAQGGAKWHASTVRAVLASAGAA